MKNNLSVALATYNEGKNLDECLRSIEEIAGEIVIVDGNSTDKTREIAKNYNAKVINKDNPKIFHINKQMALDHAIYDWILQLDADERVSNKLAKEIVKVVQMSEPEIVEYQKEVTKNILLVRHQKLIEERDGKIGSNFGDYEGFFIPRRNYFLGKYLKYGGTYPDGVIRLVKKGKAHFPCKSVHEQIEIEGKVGWLKNDLYHKDSPNFKRYLERNSRYVDLIKDEMIINKLKKNIINSVNYLVIKPIYWFLLTTIRHKGIFDGWQGIVFSFFSALRFPRAYLRYIIRK